MKQKEELDLDWLLFIQNFSLLLCLKVALKYVAGVVGCKPILGFRFLRPRSICANSICQVSLFSSSYLTIYSFHFSSDESILEEKCQK